jgi:hypothetical protein
VRHLVVLRPSARSHALLKGWGRQILPLGGSPPVTLRDRDSLEQTRVPIDGLTNDLANRLAQPWHSPKLG